MAWHASPVRYRADVRKRREEARREKEKLEKEPRDEGHDEKAWTCSRCGVDF